MSLRFDGTTSLYGSASSSPVSGIPFTISAWVNTDVLPSANRNKVVAIYDSGDDDNKFGIDFTNASDGKMRVFIQDNTGASVGTTASGVSINTWNHVVAVFSSTTSRWILLNGTVKAFSTTSRSPSTPDAVNLGIDADFTQPMDGMLAHLAIYNVALNDVHSISLAQKISPLQVRRDALVAYWPLNGYRSPETDIVGGIDMTLTGSPPGDEEPPMYRPIVAP